MIGLRAFSSILITSMLFSSTVGVAVAIEMPSGGDSGEVKVSLSVPPQIKISGFNNIVLSQTTKTVTDTLCVDINTVARTYNVTVTATGGTLDLISTNGNTIPYTVAWGVTPLSYGSSAAAVYAEDKNCVSSETNASITVTVADLSTAASGSYSSTLTINVSPFSFQSDVIVDGDGEGDGSTVDGSDVDGTVGDGGDTGDNVVTGDTGDDDIITGGLGTL